MNCKHFLLIALCFNGLMACKENPDKLFTEASTAFTEERYEQALPIYEKLLEQQFENPNLYAKLGISYAYTGEFKKCADYIQRAFDAKIDYYELYDLGALCQERLNQSDKAMAWYREGIEKFPDRYEFKNRAGLWAFNHKEVNQAMVWFMELAEKNPKNVEWNYNAGTAAEFLNNYEQAERYYRRVLEVKPKYANASYSLGSVFEKRGQKDIAEGYYKKTLKHNPDHLSALLNLAQLQQSAEPAEALKNWKHYLELAEKRKQPQKFIDDAKKQVKLLEDGTK